MVRKDLCMIIVSSLLACVCLSGTALPVFAAHARVAISANQVARTAPFDRGREWGRPHSRAWWWRKSHEGSAPHELNQYYQGNSNYNNPIHTVGGHGQGNSGNTGHNRSHNQDNSSNGGNQLVDTPRLRGYWRVNQYYVGNSNYNNSVAHMGGYNLANTGNSGSNEGLNQDNSSNGGNQIIG